MTPSLTQSQIQTVLRSFLLSILPSGVEVFQGQDNRVPEPSAQDFVVMTSIRRERLDVNVDSYNDCQFTGSIAGTVLTVSAVKFGSIGIGNTLFGTDVAANTIVQSQASGTPGGVGTYNISGSTQTVGAETMATGVQVITSKTKLTYQIDVHGPNSSDNQQTIFTLFRDQQACAFFEDAGYPLTPLYCDEGKQIPFINAEQQVEYRWVLEVVMQADIDFTVAQQFADVVTPVLVDVPNFYPAD